MSKENIESKKFHVGAFSVTDSNGALVVSSKVEMSKTFTDGVFWVNVEPFDKETRGISVAFSAVELRAFANQLKELQYQSLTNIKKHSGGKKMLKSLSVSILDEYSSFEFKQDRVIIYFRYHKLLLSGLADQIEHLINTTMDAVYKTQQFVLKNKKTNA